MPTNSSDIYSRLQQLADAIEAEMRSAGMWQEEALPDEAYRFRAAFAMDTMAFRQWLQFIFLPRVRAIVAERGELPGQSFVAAQAVREFDGMDSAVHLESLLSDLDALVSSGGSTP
ncbi:MAG TPA: YqcC family protein [Candidatus Kapabacteria bacterium]|nr:YqcC family protein [Candidatus Kapabacteria bacterium]